MLGMQRKYYDCETPKLTCVKISKFIAKVLSGVKNRLEAETFRLKTIIAFLMFTNR